jgi:2,4-dienoyl-CoA reductase-like NADH-dependent reductase (Old Yellow Enzyme family)
MSRASLGNGRSGVHLRARIGREQQRIGPQIKAAFGGVYIANEDFTRETAEETLARGEADAVAFGTPFIANPDLPRRFALKAALNDPLPEFFYAPGPRGYTDYPALPAAG